MRKTMMEFIAIVIWLDVNIDEPVGNINEKTKESTGYNLWK